MKIRKINKKGQNEMVGFVLIVVLVVVALMVFLVISVRKPSEQVESAEIENLLSAMLEYTTGCAISYEPDFDSYRDLVKDCYNDRKCNNLDKMACDYLNELSEEMMEDIIASESQIGAYELNIYHKSNSGDAQDSLLKLMEGNCTGNVFGAQEAISEREGNIIVNLKFCYIDL